MSDRDPPRKGPRVDVPDARARTRTRSTATVAPEMISQLNVEQVLGIRVRTYLRLLREPGCNVPVTIVGKQRLVDCGDFRIWLDARATTKRAAVPAGGAANDSDDDLSAQEQAELGLKPALRQAGGRR